jgi:hypothetical protein
MIFNDCCWSWLLRGWTKTLRLEYQYGSCCRHRSSFSLCALYLREGSLVEANILSIWIFGVTESGTAFGNQD